MDLTQLLPAIGNNVFIIVAFVVALSVIVAIHEYGHYIVGRWSGIHAETFSLGFGPVLASRVDKHGTKWQLAALPFGGYVKFLGDANAASVGGTDAVIGRNSRNTMMGAPLWARAATVAAGPIANFLLAIAIFAGYLMSQGQPIDPVTFAKPHDLPASFASELQAGDQISAIGGIALGQDAEPTDDSFPLTKMVDYDVVRDGNPMVVSGPYPVPPRVSGLSPRSAADEAGLKIGDVITAIDGTEIFAFEQVVTAVNAIDGGSLDLTIWRAGETLNYTMSPRRVDLPNDEGSFETRWLIGISGDLFFEGATERLGLWSSLKMGTEQLWWRIKTSLSGLWHIFAGNISTCNLSGPVGIAQASGSMAAQGAESFVLFLGMLSAAVGLLNLFPIPILDGGHLVFHAYEAVFRRKPSDRALQILMMGGLAIVGALMIFALLNDLVLCP